MKSQQKGLSLIESAMVLALAAVVTAGVLFYFNNAKEKNQVHEGIKSVQSIAAAVNKLYAGSGRMPAFTAGNDEINKLTQAIATLTGLKTGDYGGRNNLKLPAGLLAEVGSTGEGRNYYIEIQTLSTSECVAYATLNLGTSMRKKTLVFANNSAEPQGSGVGPLSVSEANEQCAKAIKAENRQTAKIRYTLSF